MGPKYNLFSLPFQSALALVCLVAFCSRDANRFNFEGSVKGLGFSRDDLWSNILTSCQTGSVLHARLRFMQGHEEFLDLLCFGCCVTELSLFFLTLFLSLQVCLPLGSSIANRGNCLRKHMVSSFPLSLSLLRASKGRQCNFEVVYA